MQRLKTILFLKLEPRQLKLSLRRKLKELIQKQLHKRLLKVSCDFCNEHCQYLIQSQTKIIANLLPQS